MINGRKGISLIVLIITIVIIIIIAGAVIITLMGNDGIISRANQAVKENNRAVREEELIVVANTAKLDLYSGKGISNPVISGDIVQPWYCDRFTINEWSNHLKTLKRAGINTVVLQWTSELKNSKIKYLGYESNLVNNPDNLDSSFSQSDYAVTKNMLGNLLEAAENNNMKVFIGLSLGNDWWNNAFTDQTWCTNNANLTNTIADEIYNNYKAKYPNAFLGWYWPWEMYTTSNNYEDNWSYMMNINLDHLTTLDATLPLMISPFVSTSENASVQRAQEQWTNIMKNTHFRSGDILCLQDGLGTSTYSVKKVVEYIKAIKLAVNENPNVEFWMNVENFYNEEDGYGSASLSRYISQLTISSLYAEKILSFSYLHYYDPLKDGIGDEYDKGYKQYITSQRVQNIISPPSGGYVYVDANRDEAPIPQGFTVSKVNGENVIDNGLVITDVSGNQFVWIPVNGGVKLDGDYNQSLDGTLVSYKKWCKSGALYNNTINDSLPSGINESDQIKKYGGFYIARYESVFDYNNGDVRVSSKPSTNCTQTVDWRNSRNQEYNGYLWNFIKYSDVKKYSEEMSQKYKYSTTIATGLVTGTQWDTIMRWLEVSNIDVHNSISWGNYNNSTSPANTGNYELGNLKLSGSNENWKAKNIYDLAGNLAEWSNEINPLNSNQSYYRSTDYNGNGIYGPASYRALADTDEYCYPNVGFRVVMYLK